MYKLVRPTKDATIYGYATLVNAGIDEVIELNTRCGIDRAFSSTGELAPSRILMDFPEIGQTFAGISEDGPNAFSTRGVETVDRDGSSTSSPSEFGTGPPNAFALFGVESAPNREPEPKTDSKPKVQSFSSEAWLRMWFANGMGMPKNYEIQARRMKSDWREGRGRLENRPITDEPVNWIQRTELEEWDTQGGDFFDSPVARQTFESEDPDVKMKVDTLLSEGIENGIILQRGNENFRESEKEIERISELKFFSLQTRTIYVPHLLVGEDTYTFKPGSAERFDEENFTAYIANLKNEYSPGETFRFQVTVERKFEQREFLGVRPTERKKSVESRKWLPPRSLTYQIKDSRTGLKYFPFSRKYTPVSFEEGTGHYFDLDLTSTFPKRKYEVLLRYEDPETGNTKLFETNQTFKVE